jgi:RimJ/RimL family protein N-acetyltransferase
MLATSRRLAAARAGEAQHHAPVCFRRLTGEDRHALVVHLQELCGWDRLARWGAPRTNAEIEAESRAFDFRPRLGNAVGFGAIAGSGRVAGAALAWRLPNGGATLAVSVSDNWRRRGIASELMACLVPGGLLGLNAGTAEVSFEAENLAMRRLLRGLKAHVMFGTGRAVVSV